MELYNKTSPNTDCEDSIATQPGGKTCFVISTKENSVVTLDESLKISESRTNQSAVKSDDAYFLITMGLYGIAIKEYLEENEAIKAQESMLQILQQKLVLEQVLMKYVEPFVHVENLVELRNSFKNDLNLSLVEAIYLSNAVQLAYPRYQKLISEYEDNKLFGWDRIVSKFYRLNPGLELVLGGKQYIPEDIDGIMNAIALVSALILTVPFTTNGILSSEYFFALQTAINACPNGRTTDTNSSYEDIYSYFVNVNLVTVTSAATGLSCCSFYYLFRRNSPYQLRIWWPKGRVLLLLVIALAIISVEMCMTIMLTTLQYYQLRLVDPETGLPSDQVCTTYSESYYKSGSVCCSVVLGSLLAIYLMR